MTQDSYGIKDLNCFKVKLDTFVEGAVWPNREQPGSPGHDPRVDVAHGWTWPAAAWVAGAVWAPLITADSGM